MAKKKKDSKGGALSATDVRGKSADELKGLILDSKKEMFNIRIQKVAGEPVAAHRERVIRKNIARIKTIQNEQKRGAANA